MRNILLDRTTAEFLIDLLEEADPVVVGTWRRDLSAEIRIQFGMRTLEQELEYIRNQRALAIQDQA